MKHLPNALTLLRLLLAPVVAWLMWQGLAAADQPQAIATNLALAALLFVLAALTDLFDGMAARAFNAHSKFGRLIDPIADKAIVGLPLIVFAVSCWFNGDPVVAWLVSLPVGVIVARDVAMTLIRLLAPDGEGARVSSLAKIKTALELVAVGSLLLLLVVQAHTLSVIAPALWAWLVLLAVTATLSAYTGFQYLRPQK